MVYHPKSKKFNINRRKVNNSKSSRTTQLISKAEIGQQKGNPYHVMSEAMAMQLQRTIGNHALSQLIDRQVDSKVIQRNPMETLERLIDDDKQSDKIRAIARHILTAIEAISSKEWQTAYNLLYNKSVAKIAGHLINLKSTYIDATDKEQSDIDAEIELAIGKGMYFDGKLDLPDVAILPDNDFMQAISPSEDGNLAMKVFPVVLEEWIHMFQHMINGFLSEDTLRFRFTEEFMENQRTSDSATGWNLNEVDIYAIYRELGWDEVLDAFRARYQERQVFEDADLTSADQLLDNLAASSLRRRNK